MLCDAGEAEQDLLLLVPAGEEQQQRQQRTATTPKNRVQEAEVFVPGRLRRACRS